MIALLVAIRLLSKLFRRLDPQHVPPKEEILQVLSYNFWMTGLEIRDALCKRRNITGSWVYFHSAPYTLLQELIEEGLVETRIRINISQVELDDRDGNYPPEYRLATGGIRRKNEQKSGAENPLSIFRPQESR